jgi:carbamoyltransferase
MYILGINAFHGDSSACLVMDGNLISAAEEERFRRIKHWAGFPSEAISYCLQEAGIALEHVGHVAVNSNPNANLFRKINYALANRPDWRLVFDRIKNKHKRIGVEGELARAFPDQSFKGKIHHIEHHLAHLASAHSVSPFEESVTVSVDGFGDFSSASWGVGRGGRIEVDQQVLFPHSLGIFYQAMTQFLGFPQYGDEYKVMGLAPYGKSAYLEQMHEMVKTKPDGSYELGLQFFRHHIEKIDYEWQGGSPAVGDLFSKSIELLLGFPRRGNGEPLAAHHYDLARSVQAMYEEAFFNLLNAAYAKYGIDRLTLAGGCAMNSVANGKVRRMTRFKQVYIQSAAGDAGGAIGAAFAVSNQLGQTVERFYMSHAYWGPAFSNDFHERLLEERTQDLKSQRCNVEQLKGEHELCQRTAQAIADGRVIGWFQGRMEWGPRALGNRSILCDPRRADMKDILNLKIKRRESFRPFAPSILREAVTEWFEEEDDVPFMMQVFQIREEKRHIIPAVTHVDGSGRLQTVSRDTNPLYYRLIETFADLTGIPLVLNTSFNENEPVVCRPQEALDCFLRTKMDVLVLGNWFISRSVV